MTSFYLSPRASSARIDTAEYELLKILTVTGQIDVIVCTTTLWAVALRERLNIKRSDAYLREKTRPKNDSFSITSRLTQFQFQADSRARYSQSSFHHNR